MFTYLSVDPNSRASYFHTLLSLRTQPSPLHVSFHSLYTLIILYHCQDSTPGRSYNTNPSLLAAYVWRLERQIAYIRYSRYVTSSQHRERTEKPSLTTAKSCTPASVWWTQAFQIRSLQFYRWHRLWSLCTAYVRYSQAAASRWVLRGSLIFYLAKRDPNSQIWQSVVRRHQWSATSLVCLNTVHLSACIL